MNTTVIVKIESGIITDIYTSDPLHVIVVDHDVIEGGESFKQRLDKSVSILSPDKEFNHQDIDAIVTGLVLECQRPADERGSAVGAAA